jgi:hypothetical protein
VSAAIAAARETLIYKNTALFIDVKIIYKEVCL